MPNSLSAPLTFYPAYCFSRSPTHNTWARLTIADVHALKERAGFEGQNLYFHLNHPIKWIRLVGVIVALDVFPTRWIMILDDSSGATIEVTCGRPALASATANGRLATEDTNGLGKTSVLPEPPTKGFTATGRDIDLGGIDVGSVVKVKGGVGSWRGEKQVLLERISTISTTTEEAAAWAENTIFRNDILDQPWVVSEEDEKRARHQAEGLDRRRRVKEERRVRKIRKEQESKRAEVEKQREAREIMEERKRKDKEKEEERRREREGERKRQNEAREKALNEMGAGR